MTIQQGTDRDVCVALAAQIGERARRTTASERYRRHRQRRTTHIKTCEWCQRMPDGVAVMTRWELAG